MVKEDIIRMAREAGYQHPDAVGTCEDFAYFDLERFAALVSAAELRRLHEAYECNTAIMHARTKRMNELLAQRDVLLKALKYVYKELRRYGRQHWSEAVKAQAAIKQVEEKA